MNRHSFSKRLPTAIALIILVLPLLWYGSLSWQRPPRTNLEQQLFQGITYRREARSSPRPLMIHTVTIDLTAPGIRPLATPGTPGTDGLEFAARTSTAFLREFNLQLAINANFFYPFREETPWDFYPHPGERANVLGVAIANGIIVSPREKNWAAICFLANHQVQMLANGECPTDAVQAVAGSALLIDRGKASLSGSTADSDGLYSRTVIGVNAQSTKLWIVAIDDKQPLYSEGVTLAELTDYFLQLGADAAVNLDGGGSTTLVAATPTGTVTLNAPIHTKIPMRERTVANHLGFYALPLKEKEG